MKNLLLDFFSPERSIGRYILGATALTVIIQISYDVVKQLFSLTGAFIFAVVLILFGAFWVWQTQLYITRAARLRPEEKPITPHKGLILMISPKNLEVPLKALEHHESALEHCWLLSTKKSLQTAEELAAEIHRRWQRVKVHDVMEIQVDPEEIASTWRVVEDVYASVPTLGLSAQDIVADITGGQKPMTAGMALACLAPDRKMQYMKTVRDEQGDPIPGVPILPVQITVHASQSL